ncbi:unnamed protein product [Chironomus riparius]|uniref:Uncharacterized protein n=1 Tax=Chironomus riparius TaxID=315576 RepID=A0A9P0IRI5_9DIPT|nr:unnamed protein product [Chironomus riparius]
MMQNFKKDIKANQNFLKTSLHSTKKFKNQKFKNHIFNNIFTKLFKIKMGITAEVNIFGEVNLDILVKSKSKTQNKDKSSKKIMDIKNQPDTKSNKRKLDENLDKESKKPKIEDNRSKLSSKSSNEKTKSSSEAPIQNQEVNFKIPKLSDKSKVEGNSKSSSNDEKIKDRSVKRDEKSRKPEKVHEYKQKSKEISKVREISGRSNYISNNKPKEETKKPSSKPREDVKKSSSSRDTVETKKRQKCENRVKSEKESKSTKPKTELKKSEVPSKLKEKSSQKTEKSEKEVKVVKPKEASKKSSEKCKNEDSKKASEKPKSVSTRNPESSKNLKDSEKLKSSKVESSKTVTEITKNETSEPTKQKETSQTVQKSVVEAPKPEIKPIVKFSAPKAPISSGKLQNFMKMYEQSMNHNEEFSSSEDEESEDEIQQEPPKERIILRINTSALKMKKVEELPTNPQKASNKPIENHQSIENVSPMDVEEVKPSTKQIPPKDEEEFLKPVQRVEQRQSLPTTFNCPKTVQVPQHLTQKSEIESLEVEENCSNPKPARKRVEHRGSFNGVNTQNSSENQTLAPRIEEPNRRVANRHSLGEMNEIRRKVEQAQGVKGQPQKQLFGYPRQYDVSEIKGEWNRSIDDRLMQFTDVLDLSRRSDSYLQISHKNPQDVPRQFVNSREGYKAAQPISQNSSRVPQNQAPKTNMEIVERKPNGQNMIQHPVLKPETVKTNPQNIRNMQAKVTGPVQHQPKPVHNVRPVIRPANQIQPAIRPANQIQPVIRPAQLIPRATQPTSQIQPVIRPAQLIPLPTKPVQPPRKPAHQIQPFVRPAPKVTKPVNQVQNLSTSSEQQVQLPTKPVNQVQPPTKPVQQVQPQANPIDQALEVKERLKEAFKNISTKKKEPVKKNSNQKRLLNIGKIQTAIRKNNQVKVQNNQPKVAQDKQSPMENQSREIKPISKSTEMLKPIEAVPAEVPKIQNAKKLEMPIALDDLDVSSDDSDDSSSSSSSDSDDSSSDDSESEEEVGNFAAAIENMVWGN